MKIIPHITDLQILENAWRQKGERIAFVPTMGNLHDGHLSLVQKAKQVADHVVVSIFVNPLQFGPNEDFSRYPRSLETDIAKLTPLHIDVVFTPHTHEIYPNSAMPLTRVMVSKISEELCGATRPGHFEGVATVVSKLFHIVQPNIAIFGEKDFQQLVVIRQIVRDLNWPIEILSGATMREADGLAMSSRNQYLSKEERRIAPKLYEILCGAQKQILSGKKDYEKLAATASEQLLDHGFGKVDYVSIRDEDSLQMPLEKTKKLIILAAAFLGKTRLIDNIKLSIKN